ncbi:hypothetical protein SLS60_010933 [Paraconiothyrium brasiliense]|uniref:Indoleamine 2,3-dioxygenase n=1 Tax=Paraconiothyrium brasiliense TaxID=300254 RepID=A0ABR3QMH1_9PLEO
MSVDMFEFHVLEDTRPKDRSLPAFMVSTTRGFLPRQEPLEKLPVEFEAVESLLQRMPIKTLSGEPGLLAKFTFGETLDKELPDLSDEVEKYRDDLVTMNALYRDYSFLASAYLFEPCHERFLRDEPYGLGRQKLPRSIALPIVKIAEIAGFKPFMEYAGSYALFNYRLQDPDRGLEYDNLRLIRAFEHGLDPTSSEAGFVLVHIAMVKESGPLIKGTVDALESCITKDRERFDDGLRTVVEGLKNVNAVMNKILQDFRQYRPGNHREFLEAVRGCAEASGVKEFALANPISAALYLQALNEVRDFRWRHWCFTREYILKRTAHPTATGGSPIVTWLPNQLQAVLEQMAYTAGYCKDVHGVDDIMETANNQRETLRKEVAKYCGERGVAP